MSSDTEIANVAMRLLKAQRITNLTDGSNNANAANDVFEEIRDNLIRSHNWNFATKRQKLARSSTAPTYEFDYAYALPSDWMRTTAVHNNDAGTGNFPYKEEEVAGQGVIVTSSEDVWLRYVYRVTDPNRMTPDFRLAFALALAVAMPGISNLSSSREEALERRAQIQLRRAKFSDAVGAVPEARPAGSWVTSRTGYPGWRAWPD